MLAHVVALTLFRLPIKSGHVFSWMDQEVSSEVLDICLCGSC